jgi:multiple sugar transport system permease protein
MNDSLVRSSILRRVVIYSAMCFWALVCLFPIYWLAVTSVKGPEDIDRPPGYLPFVDFRPSLEAWRFILADPHENLSVGFLNSLLIGVGATLIVLLTGVTALYGFTRLRPALRWTTLLLLVVAGLGLSTTSLVTAPVSSALVVLAALLAVLAAKLGRTGPVVTVSGGLTFMLASRCLPPVVLAVPLYVMARTTGTYDSVLGLLLVYSAINLPVAVWLLQPVIGAKATDEEEAAQLDGAAHVAILFGILLPMTRRAVVAAGILVFLLCWNEYLFAAVLTTSRAVTLPVWMAGQLSMKEAQVGGGAEEWAHMSAATILMMIPALVFAAFGMGAIGRATARKWSGPRFPP